MNLEEFRKALSSDATEENAQLKRQLSDLQTEYHEKLSKLENENDSLIKLHNNTRSIVEEILEMIRTKLTEVENAEN